MTLLSTTTCIVFSYMYLQILFAFFHVQNLCEEMKKKTMFVQNHFVYYDFISTYGLEKMLTSYIASHHSWVSLQKCIRQIQVSIMRLRVIMSTFFKSTVFYMGHSISWKYVTSTKFDSRINQINYLKKPILIKFQALEVPLSFNYTKKSIIENRALPKIVDKQSITISAQILKAGCHCYRFFLFFKWNVNGNN